MPGPSRLEDPSFHGGTTKVKRRGHTTEVLDVDLPHYLALGVEVVGPGEPEGPTSYTDQEKVNEFARTKRFFKVKPEAKAKSKPKGKGSKSQPG